MPVRLAVPLPGPFVYTPRRREPPDRFSHAWYWLLGIWALELAFWAVIVLIALVVLVIYAIAKRGTTMRALNNRRPRADR